MPGIVQRQVGDTIYRFPEGMAEADIVDALRSVGVLPDAQFADVESGTSRTTPTREAARTFAMGAGPGALPTFGSEGTRAQGDIARGVGKGVAQAGVNVANASQDVTGVRPIARGLGMDSTIPTPEALQTGGALESPEGFGAAVGRQLPTMAGGSGFVAGAVGGAAETGSGLGAVAGGVAGKVGDELVGLGSRLLDSTKRRAIVDAWMKLVPERLRNVGRAVGTTLETKGSTNLAAAQRTMTEAAEEQAARQTIGAAERQAQEPVGAAMAREEGLHARAAAENTRRGRTAAQADEAAQVEARRAGESRAEDFEDDIAEVSGRQRSVEEEAVGRADARTRDIAQRRISQLKRADDKTRETAEAAIARKKAEIASRKRGEQAAQEFEDEVTEARRRFSGDDDTPPKPKPSGGGGSDLESAAADAAASIPDRPSTPRGQGKTVNNASGESGASAEALGRQSAMKAQGRKFVVYDRAGQRRELIGPDAVDYTARKGETYGVESPTGFQALDNKGGKVPDGAGFEKSAFQKKVSESREGKEVLGGATEFDPGLETSVMEALERGDIDGARKALVRANKKRKDKLDLQDFVQQLINKKKGKS